MKIKALGNRVLVKVDKPETVKSTTIVIPESVEQRHERGHDTGTVIDIGQYAFEGDEPWCQVGDRIMFTKYPGCEVKIEGVLHRMMLDKDIVGLIVEDK